MCISLQISVEFVFTWTNTRTIVKSLKYIIKGNITTAVFMLCNFKIIVTASLSSLKALLFFFLYQKCSPFYKIKSTGHHALFPTSMESLFGYITFFLSHPSELNTCICRNFSLVCYAISSQQVTVYLLAISS